MIVKWNGSHRSNVMIIIIIAIMVVVFWRPLGSPALSHRSCAAFSHLLIEQRILHALNRMVYQMLLQTLL